MSGADQRTDRGELLIERRQQVAHLQLLNPTRRNAISVPMWEALTAFCTAAQDDASLRAIVVSGAGAVFSAGADISSEAGRRRETDPMAYDHLIESTLLRLEALPQVVFAAITGPCMGAGASLACACDIRICNRRAIFAVPAARLGLGYDPRGLARFVRIFGTTLTAEMLLLAGHISAERAFEVGAVHRLVDNEEVLTLANKMAQQAVELAPLTQHAAKAAMRELGACGQPSDAVLKLAAAADASADYAEGRSAFAEKRRPKFTGR